MHPILFDTKLFILHTLWVFFAIAIITASYTLIKMAIKNNLKIQFLADNAWKLILTGLIGGRILFVLSNYQSYFYEFNTDTFIRLLSFWDKGISIWGIILASLINFYLLCKKSDQNFLKWLDIIIPTIIIGLAIGHLGTFFDGINYGKETSLPWGVNFESPAIKYAVPIHPTQIYAFLYSGLIFIILFLLNETEKIRNLEPPGFIGILGITAYSFFRFLEEFVRGDDTIEIFNMRVNQILALIIFIIAATILYRRKKYLHLR